jgi:hypothetical protein
LSSRPNPAYWEDPLGSCCCCWHFIKIN